MIRLDIRFLSLPALTAFALACGGGGGGSGGPGQQSGCTTNAQCGQGYECVMASGPTGQPLDFDDGFDDDWDDPGVGGEGGQPPGVGGGPGGGGDGNAPGSGGGPSGNPAPPTGSCQALPGSGGAAAGGGAGGTAGGAGNGTGGGAGSGTGGAGPACESGFMTGSTFYKGETAFGQCDDSGHPKNCKYGYFLLLPGDGCVCTAPCNSGTLPKVGEACSTDGSWTCQTIQNSSGTSDYCVHSSLNLCQAS